MKKKRTKLKSLLIGLLPKHHLMFKRIYSHRDLDKPINEVVDEMPANKLDNAISQCEATHKIRDKWLAEWRDKQIDNIFDDETDLH